MIRRPALKEARQGHAPAETVGARLGATLGAGGAAPWAIDAQVLADAALRAGFHRPAVIDGQELPAHRRSLRARRQARVP